MSSPYRILIVDDDPVFSKSATAILESQGYQVDTAAGGDAGLAKMQEDKPDLVILDVMMDWVLDGVGALSPPSPECPDVLQIARSP